MNKSKSRGLVSSAILKSNLKRFTPLMIMGIVYFFCLYVFPAFFVENLKEHLLNSFNYSMMGLRFYCAAMPLAVSLAVCSFLHKKNSVMFHHSIPVRRTQMYLSIVFAGLIIIYVPIILLVLYASAIINLSIACKILCFGILSSTYVFSICILAGIISGTTVMHFILAVWFNFLPQTIYAVLLTYSQVLLHGFTTNDVMEDVFLMSPETNEFTLLSSINLVYIGILVILFILAGVLYNKAKLERSENVVIFNSIKVFLNVLTSIYTMAIFGFITYALKQTPISFVVSSVIGAIIGTYVGYMIFNKTFKIFNKQATKLTICIVILSMVLSLSFMFDFYRFESRVPDVNEVKSVNIASDMLEDSSAYDSWNDVFNPQYTRRDIVSNVINIQKYAIANENESKYVDNVADIFIKYNLKNGKSFTRQYMVVANNKEVKKYMKYIFESNEYKKKNSFASIEDKIKSISVDFSNTGEYIDIPAKYIDDIVKAIDKDRHDISFDQRKISDNEHISLAIETTKANNSYIHVTIYNKYKNTLKIINEIKERQTK